MDRGVNARDAGLEKIRQIDNWMIAGAIGLTLAFSAAAAQAFKGHARHGSSSAAPATSSSSGDPNASAVPNSVNVDPNASSSAPVPDQSQQVPVVPSPVVTGSS